MKIYTDIFESTRCRDLCDTGAAAQLRLNGGTTPIIPNRGTTTYPTINGCPLFLSPCSHVTKFSPSLKFGPILFVLAKRILVQMGQQPIQPI